MKKRIDVEGHTEQLNARLRAYHVRQKGPSNPEDPASVQAHREELKELGDEILLAKLRTRPDSKQGR